MGRAFNDEQRAALLFVSGGKCEKCGVKLKSGFHADHRTPFSRGGPTDVNNGQALCPKCNLHKGARMYEQIAGRVWQQEALTQYFAGNESGDLPQSFFVEACPGGGKTRFAIATISGWFDRKDADMVVVIAPQTMLAMQWADEIRTLAPGLVVEAVCSDDQALDARQFVARMQDGRVHMDVLVMTYAGLASGMIPDVIDAMARRKRVCAVFDEIHHAGVGSPWGNAVMRAFSHAKHRLLLSGTPFRGNPVLNDEGEILRFSNAEPIPFAQYTSENLPAGFSKIQTHFGYTFKQAINDDVCRNIVFTRMDGLIEWDEVTEGVVTPLAFQMTDWGTDEATRARRLAMALAPESSMSQDVIDYAMDKLSEIRNTQANAAMLVVADSIDHARRMAAYIQKRYGVDAPVVASDDPASREVIRNFKGDTSPVIVSVQMFSEGVDAPRIRVISYLSRRTAPLFFLQVIGRAVRMQSGDGYPAPSDQWAHMIMPADPELHRMALEVEEQIGHVIGPTVESQPKCPACNGALNKALRVGDTCPHCGYIKEPGQGGLETIKEGRGGFGERDGIISMSEFAAEEMVQSMTNLRDTEPLLRRWGVEQITILVKVLAANPGVASRFSPDLRGAL